ncbi:DUF5683 domain-containing protein [Chitinispirillales bacterium ANBcel5]|uniref:DUF5683 domain-containing protein n=1 Tax=Cellulosispirillum alkaliphilum TaxID=3039283 RepID=UPI002A589DB2|nr:DUF5683 domain-containing protein [Chitinispirillales bacterium ANBcel5]
MNKTISYCIALVLFTVMIAGASREVHGEQEASVSRGVIFSALLPGLGQISEGEYFKGGTVIAFEAVTGVVAGHWAREARKNKREFNLFNDSLRFYREKVNDFEGPVPDSLYNSLAQYSILSSRADYQTREARYKSINAIGWMVGGYVFSLLDALESSELVASAHQKDPQTAGLLSAVPGLALGQLYNGSLSKAGLIIMAQASLGLTAFNYHRLMQDASAQYAFMRDTSTVENRLSSEHLSYWKGRYDSAFSKRNTFMWYAAFVYLYSIFDAVVDAHLSDLPEKTKVRPDLALCPGAGVSFSLSFNL